MSKIEILKKSFLLVFLLFVSIPGTVYGEEKLITAKEGEPTSPDQILKYYNEWYQSGHADHKLANRINSDAISDPDKTSCLICHTAQGFIEWVKGDSISSGISASSSTVKAETALSPTCMACHDLDAEVAKGKGKTDPMLRLKKSPSMLMGGYQAGDLGLGANCMVCHTSIIGKINDSTMPLLKEALAPHPSTQTDVVMGENFFFVETEQPTYHLDAIYNTCTACHMGSTYKGGEPTSHHFQASFQSCSECHYDIDPESIKYSVMQGTEQLKTAIDSAVTDYVQAGLNAGKFRLQNVDLNGLTDKDYTSFSKGKVSKVSSLYLNEKQGVRIEIDDKAYLSYIDSLEAADVKLLDSPEGQIIAKAGWNLYMIKLDGSNGAHNPQFISEVLEATQDILKGVGFRPDTGDASANIDMESNMSKPAPAEEGIKIGETAPVFKLKSQDGKEEFDLKSFRDEKPVLLFFGSLKF